MDVMNAFDEVTTHLETIVRLRHALTDAAWRLRVFSDVFDADVPWRDAEVSKTRLLGIAQMLDAYADPPG